MSKDDSEKIESLLFGADPVDLFDRALEVWGAEAQIMLAIEENSELNTELARDYRERNDTEDVVDEIADVLIATRQLARIYGEEQVAERVKFKMDRLRERVRDTDE